MRELQAQVNEEGAYLDQTDTGGRRAQRIKMTPNPEQAGQVCLQQQDSSLLPRQPSAPTQA